MKFWETIGQIVEVTLVLVALYLILANSFGFSTIMATTGNVYSSSIKALQGR